MEPKNKKQKQNCVCGGERNRCGETLRELNEGTVAPVFSIEVQEVPSLRVLRSCMYSVSCDILFLMPSYPRVFTKALLNASGWVLFFPSMLLFIKGGQCLMPARW